MKKIFLSDALDALDEDLLAAADGARDARPASQRRLKKRRIGNWWRYGTVAACFLLAAALLTVFLGGKGEGSPVGVGTSQTLPPIAPSHLWEGILSSDKLVGSTEKEGGGVEESITGVSCVTVKGQSIVEGGEILLAFLQDCAQKNPSTLLGVRYPADGSVYFFEIVFDGATYACTSFEAKTPENKTARQYRFLNAEVETKDGKSFCSYVLTDYEGICWSDIVAASHSSEAVYEWQIYHYLIGYLEQTA